MLEFGILYTKRIVREINNPFWKSVIMAFIEIYGMLPKETKENVNFQPIWYNDAIDMEYIKPWDTQGLRCINDILSEDGTIMNRNDLNKNYGLNINFIDYLRLTKSIPRLWLKEIEQSCIYISVWSVVPRLYWTCSNKLEKKSNSERVGPKKSVSHSNCRNILEQAYSITRK